MIHQQFSGDVALDLRPNVDYFKLSQEQRKRFYELQIPRV